MNWLRKNKIVFIILLFIVLGVLIWRMREPRKENFSETPIVEISKVIYGKTGLDIKSILERYQSTPQPPQVNHSIHAILSDIDTLNKSMDHIKNSCENPTCDNMKDSEIENILPLIEKIILNTDEFVQNPSNNICMSDKAQIHENMNAIYKCSI